MLSRGDRQNHNSLLKIGQRPARFSFLENSREFCFIFTSRSQSRAVSISLSLLEKEWRNFIFHFSLFGKVKAIPILLFFSREKRVKSGAGYHHIMYNIYCPPLFFLPIVFLLDPSLIIVFPCQKLTQSLTDIVEAWPMWLWLLKMITQNLLMLLMLLILIPKNMLTTV